MQSSSGSDGGSAGSGSEDDRPAPIRRTVTHVGRFKRREASKAVRSYSSADLAAIVGAQIVVRRLHGA